MNTRQEYEAWVQRELEKAKKRSPAKPGEPLPDYGAEVPEHLLYGPFGKQGCCGI